MKILSWNIGIGNDNITWENHLVKDLIDIQKPDVILLQEVPDDGAGQNANVKWLNENFPSYSKNFTARTHDKFAILTKDSAVRVMAGPIPVFIPGNNGYAQKTLIENTKTGEKVYIFNTHLKSGDKCRKIREDQVANMYLRDGDIVAGDLNEHDLTAIGLGSLAYCGLDPTHFKNTKEVKHDYIGRIDGKSILNIIPDTSAELMNIYDYHKPVCSCI